MRNKILLGALVLAGTIYGTSSVLAAEAPQLSQVPTFKVIVSPHGLDKSHYPKSIGFSGETCKKDGASIMLPKIKWVTVGTQPPTQTVTDRKFTIQNLQGCSISVRFSGTTTATNCGMFADATQVTMVANLQAPYTCSIVN